MKTVSVYSFKGSVCLCHSHTSTYLQEDPPYISINEKEVPVAPPPPWPKNSIFEDEERSRLLRKLLQSKNPDDLQAANRLMVKEVGWTALQMW